MRARLSLRDRRPRYQVLRRFTEVRASQGRQGVEDACAFQLVTPSLCRRSFSRVRVRMSDCCCEDQLSIIITLASQLEFAALDEVFRLPSRPQGSPAVG